MPASYENIPNNTNAIWWKDRSLRTNVMHCAVCGLCVIAMGYDQSLLTGLQAIPSFGNTFNHPKGIILGLLTSALFFPSPIFSPISGWICDRYGRRPALWAGCVILVAGAIFMAASNTRGEFAGARVVLGIGCAICKTAAPALLNELAHPRLRSFLTASYYSFYLLGSVCSSWLCLGGVFIKGTWGWRFPAMFQAVLMAIVGVLLFFVPESPRYQIRWGQDEKALAMLAKYHANGDTQDPLVEWEYNEIKAILNLELEAKNFGYLDFCRTPGNRRRLLAILTLHIGANWVGNGLTSYYLSPILKSVGITNSVTITSINGALSTWQAICAWGGSYCAYHYGRRPLLLVTTAGMLFAYCLITGLSAGFAETAKSAIGVAVVPMLFLYELFHQGGWTPMPYGYVSEILPYGLRTKGLAIAVMSNQMGNGFNQLVNPVALEAISWKYYFVYIGLLIMFWLIIYFNFPETKGLSLEEISFVFDHGIKGAVEAAARQAEEASRWQAGHAKAQDPVEGEGEHDNEKERNAHVEVA